MSFISIGLMRILILIERTESITRTHVIRNDYLFLFVDPLLVIKRAKHEVAGESKYIAYIIVEFVIFFSIDLSKNSIW